jgi:S-DNA-T family DNA segregation ATPase FtsK/SpoIIIE
MNVSDLVGAVCAAILRDDIVEDSAASPHGTARFALNFSPDHTAAVARAILNDAYLRDRVEIKLPVTYVGNHGLPEAVLTTKPATYLRNAECSKPILLLASVEHTEEASLHEIARLGPAEIMDRLDIWIRIASAGLHLSSEHGKWWEKAATGLRDARLVSLDRFATYVLRTHDGVAEEGHPLIHALGAALPALRLPQDSFYFEGIKEKSRGHTSAWRRFFMDAARKRGSLLLKLTPSQLLLSEDDLAAAFAKVKDAIPEACHPVVERFIAAGSGWNAEAVALAECEWEDVKPLFDGLQREKYNLGQETLNFYAEGEDGLLSVDDEDYLKLLIGRRTTEFREEDTAFYEAHRNELKEDKKLKSAWDRFVYGRAIETTDLLAGIAAAMEPLFNRRPSGTGRKLRIRCDRATKRDLRELNEDAGLFFAHRYAGLRRLFGEDVTWDVGDLFDFADLVATWRAAGKYSANRSVARPALQLKFVLELETQADTGASVTCSTQIVWKFEPIAVSSQVADDWARLLDHPMVVCRTSREFVGAKTRAKTVDLADVKTLVPAYDRDRGSFVPVYKQERDIERIWRRNLANCRESQFLRPSVADELEARFDSFVANYKTAIVGFSEHGAGNQANLDQLKSYTHLLDGIVSLAKGDSNRDSLLEPILDIGVVPVDGGAAAAVVAPWHPFRLAAMWRKARLVSELVDLLLNSPAAAGDDARLFFKDISQDLSHPLYPEVVATRGKDGPQLLTVNDALLDYSLHEPPITSPEEGNDTNESPAEGSECVVDLVKRYLSLHPHERANMSVVLFNCDSARLPQAVVDKIGSIHDDDEDVRCQVLLRHVASERLRDLYHSILGATTTSDTYNASEATEDFMARLRISVIADQAPPPDPKDGCPYDIVFSQDVISRHARLEWHKEAADPADITRLLPSRWSRRRPAAADDLKSSVYLCCPVQSAEGWSYLTAVASLFRGDWDDDENRRLLPVRQLDFRDGRTARIFEETHNLGNWVVNFDELLDRRQLLNQEVRIIRYKQSATQGRNVIISSRASLSLLRSMILHRLRALHLGLDGAELAPLAERLINDANDVSGDIVLRAARRGQSASELIGVVLSRALVKDEIGDDRPIGWYFLDDYAAWMGQREEQLADLLTLSPQTTADGTLRLTIVVTEAKYVDDASLAVKRKESQKQLRDTMHRISEAIFGNPDRLDRNSWLSRIGDLVLDGIRLPAASGINLTVWRRAIREGRCEIHIRGYSHVFVPTAVEGADRTDAFAVPSVADAYQEIYGRTALKQLLLAYWRKQSPREIRIAAGADYLSSDPTWRRPGSGEPAITPATSKPARRKQTSSGAAPQDPTPLRRSAESPDAASEIFDVPGAGATPTVPDGWAYPQIQGLLTEASVSAAPEAEKQWLSKTSTSARAALQQMKLQAKLISSSMTPNSALLRFAGSANLTVDQVNKKRSELLTTFGLNVISVRPEPGAVVIAVEREVRQVVDIREVWARWNPTIAGWGNQDLLIGVREADGSLMHLSPGRVHAPHTLIAGSTGSGKSVLVQNILLAIAATNTPEQARIVLIDPKQGVDYFSFEGLAHLDGGIIDEQELASQRLAELIVEMDRRYVRFKEWRVANIAEYNTKVPDSERLPVIWLVHDEFAEWMLIDEYKEAVSTVVQRLGIKARAAGIYLVFAAQRPDANVMPMQLRANLGNRLILRVDSEGTSDIALGERGAERLLGRGHMLARLEGERGLCFSQVPFVDSLFIETVVGLTQRNPVGILSPQSPTIVRRRIASS